MIKVSTTGMAVSLITDFRFPTPGQQGHGRRIIQLSSLGFSNRDIALSVPCSRNTVSKVLKRAQELKLCWPLQDNQLPTKYCGNKPQIRDLRLYEEAMERGAVNG